MSLQLERPIIQPKSNNLELLQTFVRWHTTDNLRPNHTNTTPTPHPHHTNTTPTPQPHHTNTTLFEKSCGVGPHHNFFQKVWCWCDVVVFHEAADNWRMQYIQDSCKMNSELDCWPAFNLKMVLQIIVTGNILTNYFFHFLQLFDR